MKKFMIITILAAFSTIFFGCHSTGDRELIDDLTGRWEIHNFEINGVMQQLAFSDISLKQKTAGTFEANGNSGVNTFFGDIVFKNGKIFVSDRLASTKMAGSPEAMEFEDNFMACLTASDKFEIETKANAKILKIQSSSKKSVLYFIKK